MAVTIADLVINADQSCDVVFTSTTNGAGNGVHFNSLADFRRDAELTVSAIGDYQLLVLLLVNWLRRDASKTPSNVIGKTVTITPGSPSGSLITVT